VRNIESAISQKISGKQKSLDELNRRIRACTKCRLSDIRQQALVGEGDLNAHLMLIALAPGEKENQESRMFIGPSGQVLNRLLQTVGIQRELLYMTNLIKCMLPKNRRPKLDEIESCSQFLDEEIAIVNPEILVPLGYYATRYVFMKYHADPPEAREDYTEIYGKLIFQNNQKIYPLPHPAALIYNPSFEAETVELYQKLPTLLQTCKWYPVCPMKWFYEEGRLGKRWIELYCKGDWEHCVRYALEEQGRYHPDWMLPDGSMAEKLKEF
jgi:uracil-DNA glycosylase family 4